jgi:hypothetical protein
LQAQSVGSSKGSRDPSHFKLGYMAQKQEAGRHGQRRNQICRSEARLLCAQAERVEEGLRMNGGSFFDTIGSLLWSAAERLDKSTFH